MEVENGPINLFSSVEWKLKRKSMREREHEIYGKSPKKDEEWKEMRSMWFIDVLTLACEEFHLPLDAPKWGKDFSRRANDSFTTHDAPLCVMSRKTNIIEREHFREIEKRRRRRRWSDTKCCRRWSAIRNERNGKLSWTVLWIEARTQEERWEIRQFMTRGECFGIIKLNVIFSFKVGWALFVKKSEWERNFKISSKRLEFVMMKKK